MNLLTTTRKAAALLTLAVAMLASCEKQVSTNSPDRSETATLKDAGFAIANAVINEDWVNLVTAGSTTTVAAGVTTIGVTSWCGKNALERGYVLNEAGEKVYAGLDLSSANVMWEDGSFSCQTVTNSYDLATGSYVFRVKTQPTISNNDPCQKSKCGTIKGVQSFTFAVVAQ